MAAPAAQLPLAADAQDVMNALSRGPPGLYFSPAASDAYLRSIDAFATNNGQIQPAPVTGARIYAVANGANGVRVASAAEAQADIIGHPGAAMKGFSNAAQARVYLDVFNATRARPVIAQAEQVIHATRGGLTDALSRLHVAGAELGARVPDAISQMVKITPLHNLQFVPTPDRASLVIADHLVEIELKCLEPQPDPTAVYPLESDARGNANPVPPAPDSQTTIYSTAGDVSIIAETVAGTVTRVVPHSTLLLEDGVHLPPFEPLTPVVPLPYEGLDVNTLFWVVLQGRQVGIFRGTWEQIRPVTTPGVSIAKGFLTLQEASAFWHHELRQNWPLAEVREAVHAEDQAVQALQGVQVQDPPVVNALLNVLGA